MGGAESATNAGRRAIPSVPLAVVVGCMLAGAIYAYAVGDDTNWDWRNYHAYNVWATINHRYDIDVVPAGFQTYFNPLIYYPIYMLHRLTPLWAGLIAGAVHGLNLAAIYSLTRALLGNAANAACLAASVLLAAYGPSPCPKSAPALPTSCCHCRSSSRSFSAYRRTSRGQNTTSWPAS